MSNYCFISCATFTERSKVISTLKSQSWRHIDPTKNTGKTIRLSSTDYHNDTTNYFTILDVPENDPYFDKGYKTDAYFWLMPLKEWLVEYNKRNKTEEWWEDVHLMD